MKNRRILMLSSLCLSSLLIVGCSTEKYDPETLEITYDTTKLNLTRGEQIDLDYKVKENSLIKSNNVEFKIISGDATINEDGLLKVKTDAKVDTDIIVKAEATFEENGKSNKVSSELVIFKVADLIPNKITLKASPEIITRDNEISFSVEYEPIYSTLTDYTLELEKTCTFAEFTKENKLVLKDNIDYSTLPETVKVKAILDGDKTKTSEIDIQINTDIIIKEISCDTIHIIAKKDSSKTIITDAFDANDKVYHFDQKLFKYNVADTYKDIIEVDSEGVITPKGHGEAKVEVSYGDDVKTTCLVYVMAAPERIDYATPVNNYVKTNNELSIAIDEEFFPLSFKSFDAEIKGTNKFKMLFELKDETEHIFKGDEAGVIYDENKGIKFTKTGDVTLTIKSDSSLDGQIVDDSYEAVKTMKFHVNDGLNIKTAADYLKYEDPKYIGKTANILADVTISDSKNPDDNAVNFGVDRNGPVAKLYRGLIYKGDRRLEGNGYKLATRHFLKENINDTEHDLIRFSYVNEDPKPFDVTINNFTLDGSVNRNAEYFDTKTPFESNCLDGKDKNRFKAPYRWGLGISGTSESRFDSGDGIRTSVNNLNMNNVSVRGFGWGARFGNVVNSNIVNFSSSDNYYTGFDNDQSLLSFTNLAVDKVGTFVMEVVTDRVTYEPSTSGGLDAFSHAGASRNLPASFDFKGVSNINNWNTGHDSKGFADDNYGEQVDQIFMLLQNSLVAEIKNTNYGSKEKPIKFTNESDIINHIQSIYFNTIKKRMNVEESEGQIVTKQFYNFLSLIYTHKEEAYNKGNINNNICTYDLNKSINLKDLILESFKAEFVDHTIYDIGEKELVYIDLILGPSENWGQAIFFNGAHNI